MKRTVKVKAVSPKEAQEKAKTMSELLILWLTPLSIKQLNIKNNKVVIDSCEKIDKDFWEIKLTIGE